MKNFFKNIVFLLLTIYCSGLAATTEDINCALTENAIAVNSFEICQKDESFKMLYELFPKFFDDSVFRTANYGDIENIKYNPDVATEDQYRKFSNIIYAVFGSLTTLTYYVISFFLFYFSFFSLLRATESGDFMVQGKDTVMKSVIYGGVVGFLLLPIGGLTLIQMFVLVLAILAISLANFMFGNYLSIVQYGTDYIDPNNIADPSYVLDNFEDSSTALMARTYLSDLTKIAMCRDVTSQLILEQNLFDLNSTNLKERMDCSGGVEGFSDLNGFITRTNIKKPDFFGLNYVDVYNSEMSSLSQVRNVVFGVKNKGTCDNKNYIPYTCGEIEIKTPKMNDSSIIKIYGINKFVSKVIAISNGLSLTGGNYSRINDGWNNLHNELMQEIKEKGELNDGSFLSIEANKVLTKVDTAGIKQVSYIYHQLILNSLTTGLSFKTHNVPADYVDEEAEILAQFNSFNFNAFEKDWESIKPIANKIQKNHCILNAEGLADSYSTFKSNGGVGADLGGSLRCVDFKNNVVYGVNSSGEPILDVDEVMELSVELTADIVKDFDVIAEEVFKRRKEVETSFLDSMKEDGSDGVLNNLRQKGWLSMPTYLMDASKEIKNNNVYIKSLLSSNKFKPLQVEFNSLAPDVESVDFVKSDKYLSYMDKSNVYKYFVSANGSKNVYFDNETFAAMKIQNNPEALTNGDFDISDFTQIIMNPIAPLKQALGIGHIDGMLSDRSKSILEECKINKELCPIPKKDPLIGLSQYGHYLINVSINYFLIIVSLKGLATIGKSVTNVYKKNKKQPSKQESGIKEAPSAIAEALNKGKDSLEKVPLAGKGIEYIGKILDVTSEMLAALGTFVILLFFVGVFLAYILPLIPMIYFVVGYITWLLLIMQVMFIANIWAAHFIKFDENKDVIVRAAKNYALQILLKPLFMVVGMIFAWELFKIALFYINITIFSLFTAVAADGGIVGLMQETIFLLMLILMLYVVIKYILDMISTITEMLLKFLGSESAIEQSSSFNDMMKYYLVDKGVELSGDINTSVLNAVETGIATPIFKADEYTDNKKQLESNKEELAKKQLEEKMLNSGKAQADLNNVVNPNEKELDGLSKEILETESTLTKEKEFLSKELEELDKERKDLVEKIEKASNEKEVEILNEDYVDLIDIFNEKRDRLKEIKERLEEMKEGGE